MAEKNGEEVGNVLEGEQAIRDYRELCAENYAEMPSDYQKGVLQGLDCALSFFPELRFKAESVQAGPSLADEVDVLSCPFCGGHPEINDTEVGQSVECVNPGCWAQPQIALSKDVPADIPLALEAWNKRVGN